MRRKKREYKGKGHVSDKQAAVYGPAIDKLAKGKDGTQAEDVVEAATDPDSALHGYFEWDDTVAAHGHRLTQAGTLIRSIEVTIVREGDGEPRYADIRAFHHVDNAYRTIEAVIKHEPYQKALEARLADELERIQNELKIHRHLDEYAVAVGKVVKALRNVA